MSRRGVASERPSLAIRPSSASPSDVCRKRSSRAAPSDAAGISSVRISRRKSGMLVVNRSAKARESEESSEAKKAFHVPGCARYVSLGRRGLGLRDRALLSRLFRDGRLSARAGEIPHAPDETDPVGRGHGATGIEEVELVGARERRLVSGQDETRRQRTARLGFRALEDERRKLRVGQLEGVPG